MNRGRPTARCDVNDSALPARSVNVQNAHFKHFVHIHADDPTGRPMDIRLELTQFSGEINTPGCEIPCDPTVAIEGSLPTVGAWPISLCPLKRPGTDSMRAKGGATLNPCRSGRKRSADHANAVFAEFHPPSR